PKNFPEQETPNRQLALQESPYPKQVPAGARNAICLSCAHRLRTISIGQFIASIPPKQSGFSRFHDPTDVPTSERA
ncbi:MAG: hypothetical protein WCQ44_03810, partial [Opitutaceae bacterium]